MSRVIAREALAKLDRDHATTLECTGGNGFEEGTNNRNECKKEEAICAIKSTAKSTVTTNINTAKRRMPY